MFRGVWRDLVYSARSLAKARAFTLVSVVSLGVGMAEGKVLFAILAMPAQGAGARTGHDP